MLRCTAEPVVSPGADRLLSCQIGCKVSGHTRQLDARAHPPYPHRHDPLFPVVPRDWRGFAREQHPTLVQGQGTHDHPSVKGGGT